MESKQLNRKLSSLFWYILYGMPLVVFLLFLLSNLIYKQDTNFILNDTITTCYNSFKSFTIDSLYDTFYSVFELLGFNDLTTNTSGLLIVILVWFTQLMLLHVIVDVLTFIFKVYHKLMERVF